MSLRPSLKKLRPIIEQCESRDLTAAGLASLTAHANHAAAFHVVAADPIVAVWIKNDATRTVNFRLSVYDNGRLPPAPPDWSEPRAYPKGTSGKFDRRYDGSVAPRFYIEYNSIEGDSSTRHFEELTIGLTYKFTGGKSVTLGV
ncbi:MAG: hypothetical protein ACLQIB_17160 [Isosphaeraceae bacterium]